MKRNLALFLIILVTLTTNIAYSADPYFGIFGGGTAGFDIDSSRIDTSCGYYLGGKIGLSCFRLLRLEEELTYQRSKVHTLSRGGFDFKHVEGHVNYWSLMTNLLVNFDCPFIITPYFGGGVGYARGTGGGKGNLDFKMSHKHTKEKINQNEFAWQGIIGLKYLICGELETSFEYRYFKINDVDANHRFGIAFTHLF